MNLSDFVTALETKLKEFHDSYKRAQRLYPESFPDDLTVNEWWAEFRDLVEEVEEMVQDPEDAPFGNA